MRELRYTDANGCGWNADRINMPLAKLTHGFARRASLALGCICADANHGQRVIALPHEARARATFACGEA
jgi:hypothetical protein